MTFTVTIRARCLGDVLTIYPAASTIPEMVARLRALPAPTSVETRDEEDLAERDGL